MESPMLIPTGARPKSPLYALLIPVALSLSGCSSVDPVRFADGGLGYHASCPGFSDNYARCYQEAASACGASGYDLVTRDGSTRYGRMLGEGYSAQGAEYRLIHGSVHFRSVYLRCRTRLSLGDL